MQWTRTISARRGWFDLQLGELWRYRDLIFLLVKRDFLSLYKQTVLGPLWHVVQPLVSAAIFSVIFGQIAKIPTDGAPPLLFYLCGLLGWNYFVACLTKTSDTFLPLTALTTILIFRGACRKFLSVACAVFILIF